MVPFEHCSFHASAFVIDPIANDSISTAKLDVLGTFDNLIVRSHEITDMNSFTYEFGDELVLLEAGSRVLWAEIKRSVIAKAFTTCLSLGSWAITIGSVYTTVLVASGRLEVNSIVATFPFGDLFPPSALLVALHTFGLPSVSQECTLLLIQFRGLMLFS